jgi:hypothetical protein
VAEDARDHRQRVERQLDAVRGRLRLRGPRLAFREVYRQLPGHMGEDEQLVAFGDGSLEEVPQRGRVSSTYVVLTDSKLFGLSPVVKPLPREAIKSVSAEETVHGGAFRISARRRRDLVVRVADRRVAEEMVRSLEQPEPERGPLDALERLGRLREEGVISKREFEAKKAELLTRI